MEKVRFLACLSFVSLVYIIFYLSRSKEIFFLSRWNQIYNYLEINLVDEKNLENIDTKILGEVVNSQKSRPSSYNKTRILSPHLPFTEECFLSDAQREVSSAEHEDFEFLKTEEGKQYKTILIYHHAFGININFGYGPIAFQAACCKEARCFMTYKRDGIPVQDFDAVVFHFRNLNYVKLPEQRNKNQRWIFYEKESPMHSSRNPESYNGVFNWTMTYRRDSDIYAGYGRIYPKNMFQANKPGSLLDSPTVNYESLLHNKTKMVVWLVSNCKTSSSRENYVIQLQRFLDVDKFGKCGLKKCFQEQTHYCYTLFEKRYKFYLSFENSLCNDYVTEKFFSILRYNIVPVVLGSADYASIAPPHSYIHVDDFDSAHELAKYLLYLDRNDTAYLEYFKWKKDYIVSSPVASTMGNFCDLCERLHTDLKEKIYFDLQDWFLKKANCIGHY